MRHFQSYLIMKDKQQIVIHPELTWDYILEYRLEGCRLHTSAALKLQLFASDLPQYSVVQPVPTLYTDIPFK